MTNAKDSRRKAAEMAAEAARLAGVRWVAITDARKDDFCCRGVSFVLRPATRRDTGIAVIVTEGLLGYSPNEGLSMWGAAGTLLDLFNDPGVAHDLLRLREAA
jgi:hypothetical protein